MSDGASGKISRRNFIAGGFATLLGGLGLSALSNANKSAAASSHSPHGQSGSGHDTGHGPAMMVGEVDHERNGFDPLRVLVDWDYGTISTLPNGQTLREYEFVAFDKEIEVAPGMFFPAWTYNGRVPGPTIRCTEGDRIRIKFINAGTHPHTIHFHGIHSFEMDGVPGAGSGEIKVGESFLYEFDAEPFGCHHYHCHAVPLKRHIHKGLYGAFIVDPKEGRPPARELMMMQNAFDLNFDGGNEVYAVNTVGFEYARRPIPAKVGELIRIYLINMIEFDPINSFHLHAEFFDYYDHGTTLDPTLRRVDTIMQAQAQRGILEFSYRWPGKYMYHAHVTEFTELGWMGQFNIVPEDQFDAALQEVGLDAEWDRLATEGAASTHTGEASNDE